MIRRARHLVLLLALAGCERAGVPPMSSVAPTPTAAVNPDAGVRSYACEDGRIVQAGYPDRDTAVVDVGGHAYPLKAAQAADGVRYVGFGLQWWTKGMQEARLSRLKDGETIASDPGVICRVAPDAPQAR
jgi:membrane-bound inhibitor of C-type lysozyme